MIRERRDGLRQSHWPNLYVVFLARRGNFVK